MSTQNTAPATPDQQPSAETLQAEWDALAAERSGTGPALDAAPEKTEAAQVETKPEQTPTQPVKELSPIEQTLAQFTELAKRLEEGQRRTEGRVSALQSKFDKTAATPRPTELPSAEQVALAVEDPDEWKKLQEEFPEWGTAIHKKLEATSQALLKRIGAGGGEVKQEIIDAAVSTALQSREYARLERAHPGWQKLTVTPAYKEWYAKQPADVQALAESPWSEDAIDFFNQFKKATATEPGAGDAQDRAAALQVQRQKVLNASSVTKPVRPTAPRAAASDQDMTAAEIWEQEAARRTRRVAA